MMNIMGSYPPALVLIIGALFVPFLQGRFRQIFVTCLPLVTFFYIMQLSPETQLSVPFLGQKLELLRVDAWSKVFGYVFTLSSFATFLYGFYQKRNMEYISALFYIGSALGVVFARDLITLYIFWELMAITSAYLILSRRTQKSLFAGTRYVVVHIFGGLVLLGGIVLTIQQTGSIAFDAFTSLSVASCLILVGFLVNAAAVPLSSWLPDAYPESTVMGGVILSAYTSKTAVYALIRGFPGWDILIPIGCAMAIYGIIFVFMENDVRRFLSYSIVNQVGFMVCAIGIGTPLALAGAAAHAFCHIIYKALLMMSAGAVLHQTGKSKCTELGGLYRHMPYTFVFGTIGALALSAMPFTSGYISKNIVIAAAASQHLLWPWLILKIASACAFVYAGIHFPYFIFFGKDSGLKPKEAPRSMLIGMGFLASICIYLGLFPDTLYRILPYSDIVKQKMSFTFYDLYIHHFSYLIPQFQMIAFSILAFFLFLPLLKKTDTLTLDFDWIYRKGWVVFYRFVQRLFEALNKGFHSLFVEGLTHQLSHFSKNAPGKVMVFCISPYWTLTGVPKDKQVVYKDNLLKAVSLNTFPIGYVGLVVVFILGILVLV